MFCFSAAIRSSSSELSMPHAIKINSQAHICDENLPMLLFVGDIHD